jgi:hypothetical protein
MVSVVEKLTLKKPADESGNEKVEAGTANMNREKLLQKRAVILLLVKCCSISF